MSDDYRIRIEPPEEHHAEAIAGRLQHGLGSDEAKRLARELQGRKLAVSRDGGELVWEAARDNPFAVFSVMGGSGTPI